MKVWVDKARRPEMLGGIGGFAGLFDASALKGYDRPLLASSADGVGTKVAIAQAMDVHHTIGFDLVGMLVDDLVVCGAEPLFLTDYIATGRVVPERIAAIVQGIAEACVQAGLRADRRRDRRAPGAARPRRVRRRRLDHRRRRGDPPARPGPGPARRPGGRDGEQRAAQQRLLAGAPRAARPDGGRRLGAGPARRRARPDARRGAPRADPDLRQGLPGAGPGDPDPRDVPHHRRRAGGEPRAGAARGGRGPRRPVDLDPAAGLRAGPARSGGVAAGRPRADPQPWASAWSRSSTPTTSTGCSPRSRSTTSHAWVCGEVGLAAGRRAARPARWPWRASHPGW